MQASGGTLPTVVACTQAGTQACEARPQSGCSCPSNIAPQGGLMRTLSSTASGSRLKRAAMARTRSGRKVPSVSTNATLRCTFHLWRGTGRHAGQLRRVCAGQSRGAHSAAAAARAPDGPPVPAPCLRRPRRRRAVASSHTACGTAGSCQCGTPRTGVWACGGTSALGTSGRVVVRAGAAHTPASMMIAGVRGGTSTAFRQEGGCLMAHHPTISVMHFVSARPPPSSWSTAEAPQVIRTISRWRCQGLRSGDEGGKALGGFAMIGTAGRGALPWQ